MSSGLRVASAAGACALTLWVLLAGEASAPTLRPGLAAAARAPGRSGPTAPQAGAQEARTVAPGVAPAQGPTPAPRSVEDVLEDLEAGRDPGPEDACLLRATLEDPAAPLPLRAGALRAWLVLGGRPALAALPALFARPDAAPLRELLAHAVARGAGPEDEALLLALLAAGERAGEPEARLLALRAAVAAARRDPQDEPTRLAPGRAAELGQALLALAREAPDDPLRRAALEGLAELGGPEGLGGLRQVASGAGTAEDRLDAALLLREQDAPQGAALLERLAAEPGDADPATRDRLHRLLEAR